MTVVLGAGWDTIRLAVPHFDPSLETGDSVLLDPGDFRFDEETTGDELCSWKPNAKPVALAASVDRAQS